jgi:D-cysteine desulfhydrase
MMTPTIAYPPRIDLARLPTPMHPLERMSEKLGVALYIKRDDLTGAALSGNKVRKLEFAVAEALDRGADTLITCGGAQSNHARATAVAAAMQGLHCCLLLRTPDPAAPPPATGNILLNRMAGAEIKWITPDQYKKRDQIFEELAADLRRRGHNPYIVPEGASNAVGAWGYIRAAQELAADIADLPENGSGRTTIIHATGSGGTDAGLILGAKLLGLKARIVSVNVCDDRDYFTDVIGRICEAAIAAYNMKLDFNRRRDIHIIDGYVGRGYALSRPEELRLVCDMARTEGIYLDPVYTGKAFYGMVNELKKQPGCFGERIIFIHTGGIYGLLAQAAEVEAVL